MVNVIRFKKCYWDRIWENQFLNHQAFKYITSPPFTLYKNKERRHSSFKNKQTNKGDWVAQSVQYPTLCFQLKVCMTPGHEMEPHVGLHT